MGQGDVPGLGRHQANAGLPSKVLLYQMDQIKQANRAGVAQVEDFESNAGGWNI